MPSFIHVGLAIFHSARTPVLGGNGTFRFPTRLIPNLALLPASLSLPEPFHTDFHTNPSGLTRSTPSTLFHVSALLSNFASCLPVEPPPPNHARTLSSPSRKQTDLS